MNWVFLGIFGASCLLLIWAPLRERNGFFQFPFLAGGAVLGFLFVQAIGIVRNENLVPPGSLLKTLIMCTLCNVAVFAGWYSATPGSWRRPVKWDYPLIKLYWAGIAFLAVGAVGTIRLLTLGGGLIKSFSIDTEITQWSGLPVIYLFFATFAVPGVILVGFAALKMQRSVWRLAPAVPFLLLQLAGIVFKARRAPLVALVLTILCVVYWTKRILPPTTVLVAFGVLASAAMFVFPLIRGWTDIGGDQSQSKYVSLDATAQAQLSGTSHEFWSAVYLIQITDFDHHCMLGAGFYNEFIKFLVPKIFVGGADGKARLYLDVPDPIGSAANSYGWKIPDGCVPTGPASVFMQFSYAGAALFWLLARGMKFLWVRAVDESDQLAQILYVLLLTPAMGTLTSDFAGPLYTSAIPCVIAPLIALCFIRSAIQRPYSLA